MGAEMFDVYQRVKAAAKEVGKSIAPYAVHYPGVAVFGGADTLTGLAKALHFGLAYDNSVRIGASDATLEITRAHERCASTRFIVGGYSQGAEAVGKAVTALPSDLRGLVAASVYFGDPYFNADDVTANRGSFDANHYGAIGVRDRWSNVVKTPVVSYCHDGDPICGISVPTVSALGATLMIRDFAHIYGVTHARDENFIAEHLNYFSGEAGDTVKAAKEVSSALGLSTPTPPATASDTVFVIDSTGSMSDEIAAVEDNVIQLAQTIASTSKDFRFALVDYKDDSDNDSAYQARVDVPFTTDTAAFSAGVNSITAEGGGDFPESVYSGVMTALNLPWRDGVKKTVIVIGDAPGKDPEPTTGYTLSTVTAKAFAVDPAQIYTVPVNGDTEAVSFMTKIAEQTGGTVTAAPSTDDFISSLKTAILAAGKAPTAAITGPGTTSTGAPVKFSAAATESDPSDPIVGYDWNFGTGTPSGEYDTTTTDPIVATTFTDSGVHTVAVRARTASGLSGLATTTVDVTAASAAAPPTPLDLEAVPGDTTVTLTWKPGTGAPADYYAVEDGAGNLLEAFTPLDTTSEVSWIDSNLLNGTEHTYRVSAMNAAGSSAPAGPVTATPRGSSTPTPTPTGSPSPTPSASPTPTSSAAAPEISLSSGTVAPGEAITVRGSGFDSNASVIITLHSTPVTLGSKTTGIAGSFTSTVRIPSDTEPGTHRLVVTSGALTASAVLEVRSEPNATHLSQTGGETLPLWVLVTAALAIAVGAAATLISVKLRRRLSKR